MQIIKLKIRWSHFKKKVWHMYKKPLNINI